MKTVVYQSFRTKDVPSWIESCMESVRRWSQHRGFEYRFYDDSFFDLVPAELRPRASAFKCLLADYARLVAARDLLASGYDRAVWVDADALIFAPSSFDIALTRGYAFSREVWLDRVTMGRPQFKLSVNNAVSVFCRDQKIIDFALDAADGILRSDRPLEPVSIGTDFLSKLQNAYHFPLLTEVGILGSEMARRYLANDGRFLASYLRYQTSPIYAANLCLSKHSGGVSSSESTFKDADTHALIAKLQADEGRSFNAWFSAEPQIRNEQFDRPISRYLASRYAARLPLKTIKDKR